MRVIESYSAATFNSESNFSSPRILKPSIDRLRCELDDSTTLHKRKKNVDSFQMGSEKVSLWAL